MNGKWEANWNQRRAVSKFGESVLEIEKQFPEPNWNQRTVYGFTISGCRSLSTDSVVLMWHKQHMYSLYDTYQIVMRQQLVVVFKSYVVRVADAANFKDTLISFLIPWRYYSSTMTKNSWRRDCPHNEGVTLPPPLSQSHSLLQYFTSVICMPAKTRSSCAKTYVWY